MRLLPQLSFINNLQICNAAAFGLTFALALLQCRQNTPEAPTSTCAVPLPQVLTGHRGPGRGSQAGIAIAPKGNPLADSSHTSTFAVPRFRACCCRGSPQRPRQSISGMCLCLAVIQTWIGVQCFAKMDDGEKAAWKHKGARQQGHETGSFAIMRWITGSLASN